MPIMALLRSVVLTLMMVDATSVFAKPTRAASAVQPVEVPDFSPPPVPGFMLNKPAQPLTLDQMQKQADEAASKVKPEVPQHPTKKIKRHAKTTQPSM